MQLKGLFPERGLPHAHMCDFLRDFQQQNIYASAGFCW